MHGRGQKDGLTLVGLLKVSAWLAFYIRVYSTSHRPPYLRSDLVQKKKLRRGLTVRITIQPFLFNELLSIAEWRTICGSRIASLGGTDSLIRCAAASGTWPVHRKARLNFSQSECSISVRIPSIPTSPYENSQNSYYYHINRRRIACTQRRTYACHSPCLN
jgi:hypothetical protein